MVLRALPPQAETNDFVLPKCYRNQRDILVLSHAIGFGLYGTPVQMLQNKEHWEDVGYEVQQGNFEAGSETVIHRPARNSPTVLNCPPGFPLVKVSHFGQASEEVADCVTEVRSAIAGGLDPHDVMVIAIDDRAAKMYLRDIAASLAAEDIQSNNIIADKYSEPPFTIEGKVTLTTVYRAKGNETAFVYVVGCDAVPLRLRTGRNRLFTAFTRTKGWLRISGLGNPFGKLKAEIDLALANAPDLRFAMPDLAQIELIQRDLAEKDARLMRAREQMDELKNELGLTDDDLKQLIGRKRK